MIMRPPLLLMVTGLSLGHGAFLASRAPARRRAESACARLEMLDAGGEESQEGASEAMTPEELFIANQKPTFVREPPPYPEGLHEAAKADRDGPFWSTLGEPDATTGVRPPYLRRDDWHISSTLSAEERNSRIEAEAEYVRNVVIELPEGAVDTDEDELDPLEEKPFMKLEDELADNGVTASKFPMPQSWQEYQFLQEQLAMYSSSDVLSEADRAVAANHAEKLVGFYDEYKYILSEGWTLLNNIIVEDAVAYIAKIKKKETA